MQPNNSNGQTSRGTILILGAGNYQIDAIRYCKDLGFRVLGCSYRTNDPGIPLLDGFRQVDVRDPEGVTQYAREEGADAVYSVGSDVAIPSIAKASETLGLPRFISYETACACQDKGKMRAIIGDTQWSVPFIVAETADEAAQVPSFPAMMKPVDSQGQRGCYRVCSASDIRRLFDDSCSYSSAGQVIVERYIDGPEISVNAFLRNGELEFFMPSDRYSWAELPGGIIKEHGLPCRALNESSEQSVRQLVSDVCAAVGISEGPVYFQIKMDGDHPHVLEVTPRLDGCHMWRFIKHYCGYDLLAETLNTLLSIKAEPQPEPAPKQGDWRLTFMSCKPGVPFNRDAYDVEGAEYLQWYYESGDRVLISNGIMEKCGYRIHRVK